MIIWYPPDGYYNDYNFPYYCVKQDSGVLKHKNSLGYIRNKFILLIPWFSCTSIILLHEEIQKDKHWSMLGHGKGMFYPHTSLINHLSTCVYICSMNKYRRNNKKRWMKSINNKLGKSRYKKQTFSIFIWKDINSTIDVQMI